MPPCLIIYRSPNKTFNTTTFRAEIMSYIFAIEEEVDEQATYFWKCSSLRVWYVNCTEPLTTRFVEIQKVSNKPASEKAVS